jgi:hypothetical protein
VNRHNIHQQKKMIILIYKSFWVRRLTFMGCREETAAVDIKRKAEDN